MPGALSACERCGLPSDDVRPLSGALRWSAALALAFVHAGLWTSDALKARLCGRCRRRVGLLCGGAIALAAAAVLAGASLLLRAARS